MKIKKDDLHPYYPDYNRNVGMITEVNNDYVVASINKGRSGETISMPTEKFYNFAPQVGDRVLYCDHETEGALLVKLSKSRQEKRRNNSG